MCACQASPEIQPKEEDQEQVQTQEAGNRLPQKEQGQERVCYNLAEGASVPFLVERSTCSICGPFFYRDNYLYGELTLRIWISMISDLYIYK